MQQSGGYHGGGQGPEGQPQQGGYPQGGYPQQGGYGPQQQGGYGPQQQGYGGGGGWAPPPAPSRNPWPWIAAAIAVVLLVLVVWLLLDRDGDAGEPVAVVSESPSPAAVESAAPSPAPAPEASAPAAAPAPAPSPEPAAPAPQQPAGDAEEISDAEPNLQYDIGTIEQVVDDDGVLYVRFNRWQRIEDGASGPAFTDPPTNAGATDVRFIDENPRLRSYPIAPQAFVGEISNYDALCNFQEDEPQYQPAELPTLVQQYPDALFTLTFNEFGEVIEATDERSC